MQHPPTLHPNGKHHADPLMTARIVPASATFIQPNIIKGSLGDFSNHFKAGQPIEVLGSNLNNGERKILAITVASTSESITTDLGVKTEGPIATSVIRTV